MNSNKWRCPLAVVVVSFVCSLFSDSVVAQAPEQPEFTCQIRVSPQSIAVYEPLRLDVKVQYHGAMPRKAYMPRGSGSALGLKVDLLAPEPVTVANINVYQR